MDVKTCEGFEISLYLQANKLAFHSVMNTGHKYDILGSETKDSILVKTIAVSRVKSLVAAPCFSGQCNKGHVTSLHSLDCIPGEEPQVSETTTCVKKLIAKLSSLCPRGRRYFYCPGAQINFPSSPEKGTIF